MNMCDALDRWSVLTKNAHRSHLTVYLRYTKTTDDGQRRSSAVSHRDIYNRWKWCGTAQVKRNEKYGNDEQWWWRLHGSKVPMLTHYQCTDQRFTMILVELMIFVFSQEEHKQAVYGISVCQQAIPNEDAFLFATCAKNQVRMIRYRMVNDVWLTQICVYKHTTVDGTASVKLIQSYCDPDVSNKFDER